jgi:hypothetical protein
MTITSLCGQTKVKGKPSEIDWDIWRSLLRNTVLARGRTLRKHLGDWLGMDPDWQWYYCPEDNRLYQKLMQGWQCFACIIDRPKWPAFSTTPQYTAPQSTLYRATVNLVGNKWICSGFGKIISINE